MNGQSRTENPLDGPIRLRDMGSFYVGGRKVRVSDRQKQEVLFSPRGTPVTIDPNGDYWVEQMYVQYYLPEHDATGLPLLLWHGGGSTGATWETTPDGRDGWLNVFLKLGWPVYCSDAVERGRSGWPSPPVDVWQEQPSRASFQDVMNRMRSGPLTHDRNGKIKAAEECQFPFGFFDDYMKGSVPRWIGTDQAVLKAYLELVARIGPCVILATSQGASFASRVAETRPDLVKGLVLAEPAQSGSGQPLAEDFRVPMLGLFGDYIETDPRWIKNREACRAYACAIRERGVPAEVIDLPAIGMRGNTHCMPCEQNNTDVARLIHRWLMENVIA